MGHRIDVETIQNWSRCSVTFLHIILHLASRVEFHDLRWISRWNSPTSCVSQGLGRGGGVPLPILGYVPKLGSNLECVKIPSVVVGNNICQYHYISWCPSILVSVLEPFQFYNKSITQIHTTSLQVSLAGSCTFLWNIQSRFTKP